MNKKGHILVNLGQFEDNPPAHTQRENLNYLEWEHFKNEYYVRVSHAKRV